MSSGPGYAMGTSAPSGWTPQQIRYYQLSMQNTSMGIQYIYSGGSGITTSTNISSFIDSVVAGDPDVGSPLPSDDTAPNIILTEPCYVVVQLDSSKNWAFQPSAAPMLTQADLPTKYCALNLVDGGGNIYSAQAPSSPACLILYFSVVTVAPVSSGVNDPFSYYFQFTQQDGDTYNVVLDPTLKNQGPIP
jgi:hypothetical protein